MIMRVNREVIILLLIDRCEHSHSDIANQFAHCQLIQSPSLNDQWDVIITLIKFFMSSNACASWTESVLPCNRQR